jgi:hypothetical protein
VIELLFAIVIAAGVFVALVWQIYRAVTTAGLMRWTAIGLSVATLMIMAGTLIPLMALLGAAGCIVFAPIAIWHDTRWSKLLPLVQLVLGIFIIIILPALSS